MTNTSSTHDSETLALGQQVITACAFIHHPFEGVEKVFLPRRASTKKFLPDVYELPGGHIEFGEDIVEGLKREIHEEFEMQVEIGDPFYVFTYHNQIKKSHSIEVVFFAKFKGDLDAIRLHQEDHSEYKWFSEKEVSHIIDSTKLEDDPEIKALYKGFSLLTGDKLHF